MLGDGTEHCQHLLCPLLSASLFLLHEEEQRTEAGLCGGTWGLREEVTW